jgi:type VI secretion system secreted protein Hcp
MALDATILAVGQKQSTFKGSNPLKNRQNTSIVLRSEHEISAPRDAHSGLATGKRIHSPYQVWMPLDQASVQWFTALTTNETLTKVTIQYFQPATAALGQIGGSAGSGGEVKPYYIVEFINANVSSAQMVQPDTRSLDPDVKNREIFLKVAMTYMEITETWTAGGQSFHDNWIEPT